MDDTAAGSPPLPAGWRIIPGHDSVSDHLGPFLSRRRAQGGFAYGFRSDDRHRNINGVLHGGVMFTFADHFMGLSVAAQAKRFSTTVKLNVAYLSPGRIGDFIEGEIDSLRLTRSLGFASGRVFAQGRTLMTAEGVWKLIDPPKRRRAAEGDK